MRITILIAFYGLFSALALCLGKIVDESVFTLESANDSMSNQENISIDRIHKDSVDSQLDQEQEHLESQKESQQPVDLLAEEIKELQGLIELQKTKLNLLESLRNKMLESNITLKDLNPKEIKKKSNVTTSLPQSSLANKITTQIYPQSIKKGKSMSLKSQQNQQMIFASRITKKFTISLDLLPSQNQSKLESTTNNKGNIGFLNSFSYKSNGESKTHSMMLCSVNDSNESISVFDFSGKALTDPYSPGHRISHLALSQHSEDVFVSTVGDDCQIRIGRIENSKMPSQFSKDNELKFKVRTEQSIILSSLLRETTEQKYCQDILAFQYIHFKGQQKYFLISDNQGALHLYNQNGTFASQTILSQDSSAPVLQIQKIPPYVLFYTSKEVGFFSLITLKKAPFSCINDDNQSQVTLGRVITAKADGNVVYAYTDKQILAVFDFKPHEEYCKLRRIFDLNKEILPHDDFHSLIDTTSMFSDFITIRNHILLIPDKGSSIRVLNSTDGSISDAFEFDFKNFLGTTHITQIQGIISNKIYSGNYLTMLTQDAENKTALTMLEFIIPIPKEVDYLSNIRIPLIVTVAGGIIGYQVWKSLKQKDKYDSTKKVSTKGKPTRLKQSQQSEDSDSHHGHKHNEEGDDGHEDLANERDIGQYKQKINQLEETTNNLSSRMNSILKNADSSYKPKNTFKDHNKTRKNVSFGGDDDEDAFPHMDIPQNRYNARD